MIMNEEGHDEGSVGSKRRRQRGSDEAANADTKLKKVRLTAIRSSGPLPRDFDKIEETMAKCCTTKFFSAEKLWRHVRNNECESQEKWFLCEGSTDKRGKQCVYHTTKGSSFTTHRDSHLQKKHLVCRKGCNKG